MNTLPTITALYLSGNPFTKVTTGIETLLDAFITIIVALGLVFVAIGVVKVLIGWFNNSNAETIYSGVKFAALGAGFLGISWIISTFS